MYEIKNYNEVIFENIKHIDEYGTEYWYARELQQVLEYKKWQKFINVIENAKIACEQSKFIIDDHFIQMGKMVDIGSKTTRSIIDYKLSRYICYLIVQNADPNKEVVALGQTYFAIQTRRQELNEKEYNFFEVESCVFKRWLKKRIYSFYPRRSYNVELINNDKFFDRFIILDKKVIYYCGSSFKDLGKKCFAINKLEDKRILISILNEIDRF